MQTRLEVAMRGIRLPFAIGLAVAGMITLWEHSHGASRIFLYVAIWPVAIATAWLESQAFAASFNKWRRGSN